MQGKLKHLPMLGITLCKGLILIRPDAGEAVIAHEKVHESEWTPLWLIRYLLSPMFRMNAEVRGYKMQASIEGIPWQMYGETIADSCLLRNWFGRLLPGSNQALTELRKQVYA